MRNRLRADLFVGDASVVKYLPESRRLFGHRAARAGHVGLESPCRKLEVDLVWRGTRSPHTRGRNRLVGHTRDSAPSDIPLVQWRGIPEHAHWLLICVPQ